MNWAPPPIVPAPSPRDLATVDQWRVAIQEIASIHGLPRETWSPFPSGSDVVWGSDGHVIKLTTPRFLDELQREELWLRALEGKLPWRTPRVRAEGSLRTWPYLVMERVPGVAAARVWGTLPRDERIRLARALGADVRVLHGVQVDALPDRWDDFLARCLERTGERHAERWIEGVPGQGLCAQVDAFVEEHLQGLRSGPWDPTVRSPLHTELLGEHLLLDQAGPGARWQSCIDFADACIGVPAYDFAACVEFIFRGEAGVLRAFLLGYGIPERELGEGLSRTMLAWALVHRFGSLARSLQVLGDSVPVSLDEVSRRLYNLDPA